MSKPQMFGDAVIKSAEESYHNLLSSLITQRMRIEESFASFKSTLREYADTRKKVIEHAHFMQECSGNDDHANIICETSRRYKEIIEFPEAPFKEEKTT